MCAWADGDIPIRPGIEYRRNPMPTPVDDLKVGQFVAVVGCRCDPPKDWTGTPVEPTYNGIPWEIVSVSLPFLCVSFGGKTIALDTRVLDFQRVSRHYFDSMKGAKSPPTHKARKSRRRERPDPARCVRCGERLRQTMSRTTNFVWRVVCPNCGLR